MGPCVSLAWTWGPHYIHTLCLNLHCRTFVWSSQTLWKKKVPESAYTPPSREMGREGGGGGGGVTRGVGDGRENLRDAGGQVREGRRRGRGGTQPTRGDVEGWKSWETAGGTSALGLCWGRDESSSFFFSSHPSVSPHPSFVSPLSSRLELQCGCLCSESAGWRILLEWTLTVRSERSPPRCRPVLPDSAVPAACGPLSELRLQEAGKHDQTGTGLGIQARLHPSKERRCTQRTYGDSLDRNNVTLNVLPVLIVPQNLDF